MFSFVMSSKVMKKFSLNPSALVKYVIGEKGKNIQEIQLKSKTKITVMEEGKSLHIGGESEKDVELAWQCIEDTLQQFGWTYNKTHKVFQEVKSEGQKLFGELEVKIQKEATLMEDNFEKSQKAFKQGKKAEAKLFSDEGKKHQELMHGYQKESSEKMFEFINKKNGLDVIDLHGQYSQFALEFVKQRIQLLKKKGIKKLTIIHGAGVHSDKHGPKIKPLVIQHLKSQNILYDESNAGQVVVSL